MTRPRKFDLTDTELQRQLSILQILDAISGQVDRHPGNYKIFQGPTETRVIGIDNDFAFGVNNRNPNKPLSGVDKYPGLPPFLDRRVGEKILQLSEDQIRAAVADLLTPEEVEVTVDRFKVVKGYVVYLQRDNKLVVRKEERLDDDDLSWGPQTAQAQTMNNSYFGNLKEYIEWGVKEHRIFNLDPAKHGGRTWRGGAQPTAPRQTRPGVTLK